MYLSKFAKSLLLNLDNNACEQINNEYTKRIGGKRIFYGQSGGYNARIEATIIEHNSREYYLKTLKALAGGKGEPGIYQI